MMGVLAENVSRSMLHARSARWRLLPTRRPTQVNATDVAAARAMRRDLLERLVFAKTEDERHVLV